MTEPHLFLYVLLIAFLVLLSAFFAASETAFISLGKHQFKKIAESDAKRANRIKFWMDNPNKILVTTLVGNNIVNIFASILAATLSYRIFERASLTLVTGIMTFIILVFAEIMPKNLAKKHSEKAAYFFAVPLRFFCTILMPVVKILLLISNFFIRIFGGKADSILPVLTEEDLKAMIIAGEEEGIIEEEERDMIDSIFELGDKMVKEIMTARVNIVSVKEETLLENLLEIIAKEGYSRIPVYKESIDKITGIVYIKDIIAHGLQGVKSPGTLKIKDFMREPYFVPVSKKVNDLIRELQEKKMQMAIVLDEYGGTAGLVTMEDLVEEIVGEISDEYKKEIKELHILPEGDFLVSGSMEVEKTNEEVGIHIPEGEFETIAGFVLDHLGKFPLKGESFVFNNHKFTIQESDAKKVRLVRIKKLKMERENE